MDDFLVHRIRQQRCDSRFCLSSCDDVEAIILPANEQVRPILPPVWVSHPVSLVQDQARTFHRSHLYGAAADMRVLVDLLLASHEANLVDADAIAELLVHLVGKHPQRSGIDVQPVWVSLVVRNEFLDCVV